MRQLARFVKNPILHRDKDAQARLNMSKKLPKPVNTTSALDESAATPASHITTGCRPRVSSPMLPKKRPCIAFGTMVWNKVVVSSVKRLMLNPIKINPVRVSG